MYSDDYSSENDECDDGRQQLQEYEWHCQEVQYKARALLSHPGALVLSCSIAQALAGIVQEHATSEGNTTLKHALTESVLEEVVIQAMREHQGILDQPVSREGYIAIRRTVDRACWALESLLSAEAS